MTPGLVLAGELIVRFRPLIPAKVVALFFSGFVGADDFGFGEGWLTRTGETPCEDGYNPDEELAATHAC
jgi:hypothetical protein